MTTDGAVPSELRVLVVERARGRCEYCGADSRFATQSLSVEHVVPRSRGGATEEGNLALSCQGCNNHKYNKIDGVDPVTGVSAALYHPRKDGWAAHFAWSSDATLVVGLTPTGRATVTALALNRAGLVNLRRVLFAAGEHPPR